jgi:hypothetical protein
MPSASDRAQHRMAEPALRKPDQLRVRGRRPPPPPRLLQRRAPLPRAGEAVQLPALRPRRPLLPPHRLPARTVPAHRPLRARPATLVGHGLGPTTTAATLSTSTPTAHPHPTRSKSRPTATSSTATALTQSQRASTSAEHRACDRPPVSFSAGPFARRRSCTLGRSPIGSRRRPQELCTTSARSSPATATHSSIHIEPLLFRRCGRSGPPRSRKPRGSTGAPSSDSSASGSTPTGATGPPS